ncbi:HU family DNA-binding protein [Parabacteroides sp.]|nr:HU family DNA-binding protein [Parabacteroides sp.]
MTGETCLIRPRRSVKFKPGKMLLQKLNNTDK